MNVWNTQKAGKKCLQHMKTHISCVFIDIYIYIHIIYIYTCVDIRRLNQQHFCITFQIPNFSTPKRSTQNQGFNVTWSVPSEKSLRLFRSEPRFFGFPSPPDDALLATNRVLPPRCLGWKGAGNRPTSPAKWGLYHRYKQSCGAPINGRK